MFKRLGTLLLILGSLACFHNWPAAEAAPPEVNEAIAYLNQFPVIRLWIPDSPNLGFQTTAVESLKRVHALGYRGKIEVLAHPKNQTKLPLLLPEVRGTVEGTQDFGWYSLSWFSPHPPESPPDHVPFAWSAGDEHPEEKKNELYSADTFLVLQPQCWLRPSGVWTSASAGREAKFTNLTETLNVLPHPACPAAPAPIFSPSDQLRIELLQHVLENHAYLPAYSGWAITADLLYRMADTLGRMQTEEGTISGPFNGVRLSDKLGRGVIIPVFSKAHETLKESLARKLDFYFGRGQSPLFIRSTDLDTLRTNPRLLERLDERGGVLVVFVGPLPQAAFHDFLRESDLPPLTEGVATSMYLRQIGKPFMLAGDHPLERLFPEYSGRPGFAAWQAVTPVQNKLSSEIEAFLNLVRQPNNPVQDLLREMKKDAGHASNDALVQGILEARKANCLEILH